MIQGRTPTNIVRSQVNYYRRSNFLTLNLSKYEKEQIPFPVFSDKSMAVVGGRYFSFLSFPNVYGSTNLAGRLYRIQKKIPPIFVLYIHQI